MGRPVCRFICLTLSTSGNESRFDKNVIRFITQGLSKPGENGIHRALRCNLGVEELNEVTVCCDQNDPTDFPRGIEGQVRVLKVWPMAVLCDSNHEFLRLRMVGKNSSFIAMKQLRM